jgi:hypothetical protein
VLIFSPLASARSLEVSIASNAPADVAKEAFVLVPAGGTRAIMTDVDMKTNGSVPLFVLFVYEYDCALLTVESDR